MTSLPRTAFILAVVCFATVLSGGVALADHQRAICEVSAQASTKLELGYVISVKLTTSDSRPVNDAPVRFYRKVEFFGPREMLIGSGATDGQGRASLAYLPARTGTHEIVVRFPGRDHLAQAVGQTAFEATIAAPPYRQEPAPLASFTAGVPYVVGVIVLAVWGLIAFALFGTARGIAVRAAHTSAKEDTA